MKNQTLSAKMMTKQIADRVAKELAVRQKRSEGGIAVRRGQIKGEKNK